MTATVSQPFLGSGIIRPFRRGASDVANDVGLNLIQACVAQCLGTRTGEIAWRPEFGSQLYKLKHRKGPTLIAMATHYVTDCLSKWEPRVIVTSVNAYYGTGATSLASAPAAAQAIQILSIDLVYDVIRANVPGNRVLYSGVEQSVAVALAA